MLEAIFVDQDNTLINTREVLHAGVYMAAIRYLAKKLNRDEESLWVEWRQRVDENKNSLDPKIKSLEYSLGQLGAEKEDLVVAMQIFEDELRDKIQLMPGVNDFLNNKLPGVKYILFTEDYSNQMRIKFEKFGYKDKFDLIISHEDTGKMKPDISFYKIAWEKFNLDPKKCLYIGDDYEKDCRIGVENGGNALVFGKDFTDFRQLEDLLKNYQ